MGTFDKILSWIIGLAILSVIVSKKAQTGGVISSISSAFNSLMATIVAPVSAASTASTASAGAAAVSSATAASAASAAADPTASLLNSVSNASLGVAGDNAAISNAIISILSPANAITSVLSGA